VARWVKDIVLVGLGVRVAVGPRGVAVGVGVGLLPTRTTISRGAPKFPPVSCTRAATMVLPSRNAQALAICAQYWMLEPRSTKAKSPSGVMVHASSDCVRP